MTPLQRLALSRQAIVEQLHRRDRRHESAAAARIAANRTPGSESRWVSLGKNAFQTWWQRHPASIAFEIAQPALAALATSNPWRLLMIAAGVGVLAVVLRPWRMLSLSGLLFAAVRGIGLPRTLFSMATGLGRRASPARRR